MSNLKKTLDPELLEVNLFYKKDFYKKTSNYLDVIKDYESYLDYAINYNKTFVSNDVIEEQANFFANLDSKMSQMEPQLAAYWIEAYNNSFQQVKNEVFLKIGKGTHYKPISDSMGILSRQDNYYDDSTQYVSDVSGETQVSPSRYGASSINKISPYTFLLMSELSKKTNIVFRKNLSNIQSSVAVSTQAHGDNLVPDSLAQQRNAQVSTELKQKIYSDFKTLYPVIQYYCNYNPRRKIQNLQYISDANVNISIEGIPVSQDLLMNQLVEVNSGLTSQKVLGIG
jgi:hypothetical protein